MQDCLAIIPYLHSCSPTRLCMQSMQGRTHMLVALRLNMQNLG